jgi:hypothetical protein
VDRKYQPRFPVEAEGYHACDRRRTARQYLHRVDSQVRHGTHVTLVRDATAAFSHEMMHAAHELNGPTYAHSILTTAEVIAALPKAVLSEENVQ